MNGLRLLIITCTPVDCLPDDARKVEQFGAQIRKVRHSEDGQRLHHCQHKINKKKIVVKLIDLNIISAEFFS